VIDFSKCRVVPGQDPDKMDFRQFALAYCYFLAQKSPDPSTQNGAIIPENTYFGQDDLLATIIDLTCKVSGTGNSAMLDDILRLQKFPGQKGCNSCIGELSPKMLESRDAKLEYFEHAERAAVFNLYNSQNTKPQNEYGFGFAREKYAPLDGKTMYCPFIACSGCARAIVASGIRKVHAHNNLMKLVPTRWHATINAGLDILHTGNVQIELMDGPVPYHGSIRFDGMKWFPNTCKMVGGEPGLFESTP